MHYIPLLVPGAVVIGRELISDTFQRINKAHPCRRIPFIFENIAVNETATQKVQRYASMAFLHLGSNTLGYAAALVWTGVTVSPILVGGSAVAVITGLFLIAYRYKNHKEVKTILLQNLAAAVGIFATSFLSTYLLTYLRPQLLQAKEESSKVAQKAYDEFAISVRKFTSTLPESQHRVTKFIMEHIATYFYRSEVLGATFHNSNFGGSFFGLLKYLATALGPVITLPGTTGISIYAIHKDAERASA